MRKLLLCFALLLPAGANVYGQEAAAGAAPPPYGRRDDPQAEAARLLASEGHRERAWGAYLAGRDELRD